MSGISEEHMNEMLLKQTLGSRFYNVGKIIIEKNILSPDVVENILQQLNTITVPLAHTIKPLILRKKF